MCDCNINRLTVVQTAVTVLASQENTKSRNKRHEAVFIDEDAARVPHFPVVRVALSAFLGPDDYHHSFLHVRPIRAM